MSERHTSKQAKITAQHTAEDNWHQQMRHNFLKTPNVRIIQSLSFISKVVQMTANHYIQNVSKTLYYSFLMPS